MDQTAPPNIQPISEPVPAVSKKSRLPYLLLVILVVLIGTGGYYLGIQKNVNQIEPDTTSSETSEPAQILGVGKTRSLLRSDEGLLGGPAQIELSYLGVLVNMDPGKSWTIEKDGKTATIANEGDGQIRYIAGSEGGTVADIDPSEIKIGDTVRIITNIGWRTGKVSVVRVRLVTPPETSQPSQ